MKGQSPEQLRRTALRSEKTRPTVILASAGNGMNQLKVVGHFRARCFRAEHLRFRGLQSDSDSRRVRSGAHSEAPKVGDTLDYDGVIGLLAVGLILQAAKYGAEFFLIVAAEVEDFEPCGEFIDKGVEVGSGCHALIVRVGDGALCGIRGPKVGTESNSATAIMECMTIQRMEHVGIVVDDLAAATKFFVELGLELQGEVPVEGRWVDRVVGLDGVRADIAMLQTPDGHGRLHLPAAHI